MITTVCVAHHIARAALVVLCRWHCSMERLVCCSMVVEP